MSNELRDMDGLEWISKGTVIPADTETEAFNTNSSNVLSGERFDGVTHLKDWFGGDRNIELDEQVRGLGSYGKCLTSAPLGQTELI